MLLVTTIPTLHLNGTGATTLRDEYAAAYDAIEQAIRTLGDATSNARDFYPQGPNAYWLHRKERDEAFVKLREVQSYIEALLTGICDQL